MNKPVFIYKGFEITFQTDDGSVMVNATEMAKPFNASPAFWLRNQQAQEFLRSYCELRNRKSEDVLNVVHGDGGGTWMHEDVALEFARWLSPSFAIWCNDRIKELLKVGMTAMPQTVEAMLADPDLVIGLATQLKTERQKVQEQAAVITSQQTALKEAEPKVLFADAVAASKNSILIRELAKLISQNGVPIGEKKLFAWLRFNKYLCSYGESRNLPTQKSMVQGLMEIKKTTRIAPNGTIFTDSTPKITGKGQRYFIARFLYDNMQ
jgi:phage antirepressor YoqD-like protein